MRDPGIMSLAEREEVCSLLREELQSFWAWLVEELGEEYFVSNKERPSESLEQEAENIVTRKASSERRRLWERDHYAFYDHPHHPSIYRFFEVEDLEILHYPEVFSCEHYRLLELRTLAGETPAEAEQKYEQSFGVLLASPSLGWMYRLDLCAFCGLMEVWSMQYNPQVIAIFTGTV